MMIPLLELRKFMDNTEFEIKEQWFFFKNADDTKVRILVNYVYNKFMLYQNQIGEWKAQLEEDVQDYDNIENYLNALQEPYKFLNFKGEREEQLGMTFDKMEDERKA